MSVRKTVATLLICALAAGSLATLLPTRVDASEGDPEIAGTAAIVIDAETGSILYEDNAGERLAPASLTKIFTAYFAIDATPLQRRMTVVKDDLVGEASAGLNAGDNLSLETLLHGLLLASGNDAAMTVARNVGTSHAPSGLNGVSSFTSYVNGKLTGLGLTDTHLANPHGLDEAEHYSSAHDIAAMTMLALKTEPDFVRILAAPGYSAEGVTFDQRNQLIGNYPGAIGGKTGITDDAGYCLMSIAQRDGRTLISVVLGSTADNWYTDSMALLDHGFGIPTSTAIPSVSLIQDAPSALTSSAAPSAQSMELQAAGTDTISVRPALAGTSTWPVLRWPVGAMLSMLVALVVAIQGRALIELQKRPMARGMRPRRKHARPVVTAGRHANRTPSRTPQPHETQPFTTARGWEVPAQSWSPGIGD